MSRAWTMRWHPQAENKRVAERSEAATQRCPESGNHVTHLRPAPGEPGAGRRHRSARGGGRSAGAEVLPDTPLTRGARGLVLRPPLGLVLAAVVGDLLATGVDRARDVRRGRAAARGGRRGR